MTLDIVIPSLNRREKLQNCLNSIFRSAKTDNIQLILYFSDNDEITYWNQYFSNIANIQLRFVAEYRVPTFWNDYLLNMKADALCYLNDDVELFEDTIEIILTQFIEKFPDYDGIMGLNQSNLYDINKVESAFGVIGTKYADRFPNRQVWCPDYYRFYGDWELWKYAKEINKFYFCQQAQLNHYHPATNHKLEDDTHKLVRTYLKQDKQTFQKRQSLNLLWGKSFTLVNS
jgi:glycosyltransferase involved in cell wall biosynthesis